MFLASCFQLYFQFLACLLLFYQLFIVHIIHYWPLVRGYLLLYSDVEYSSYNFRPYSHSFDAERDKKQLNEIQELL